MLWLPREEASNSPLSIVGTQLDVLGLSLTCLVILSPR